MTIDETLLMAYVDGELPPAQRAEVEALVARDADAAALVAALEASKLDYAGAFAAQPLPPVPESLVRSVDALIASHRAGTAPGAAASATAPTAVTAPAAAAGPTAAATAPVQDNVASLEAARARRRGVPVWLAAACMAGAFGAGLVIRGGLPGTPVGPAAPGAPGMPGTPSVTVAGNQLSPWVKAAMEYQQLYTRDSVAYVPDVDPQTLARFVDDARDQDKLDFQVPDLSAAGLQLKSVARLRFRNKALVQIVYLPRQGAPISLCILAEPKDDQGVTASQVDAMRVMTWRQARLGYALLGNTQGLDLEAIARQIADGTAPRYRS